MPTRGGTNYNSIQVQNMSTLAPAKKHPFIFAPYDADLNPGNPEDRKLILVASKEAAEDKKITVKQSNAKEFLDMVLNDCSKFSWGAIVHKIEIGVDKFLSIVKDTRKLSLDQVKNAALRIWGNTAATFATPFPTDPDDMKIATIDPVNDQDDEKIFYKRVRSRMIADRLLGTISTSTRKTLFTKKNHFTWLDNDNTGNNIYDGPSILFLLMESVNPNTRVGVSDLKAKIRTTRMEAFEHNVSDMLDEIESSYNQITELGYKHDDIVMDTFDSILSSKNQIFRDLIQRTKDDWEMGKDMELSELAATAMTKYNNMIRQKIYRRRTRKKQKSLP